MFLVKEYMRDIIEVMKDTTFDENIWLRVPGERGTKDLFVRQGEVMLVGDFNARIGKAGQPDDIIGQYGEEKGTRMKLKLMLKFL